MGKTYLYSLLFFILAITSVAVPRFWVEPGGGLAAAASGTVIFLALFLLAGMIALLLFFHTIEQRDSLTFMELFAGLSPLPLIIVAVFVLIAQIPQ